MRVRGLAAAVLALACIGISGCSNWQGTSADPAMLKESTEYKDNNDPQNTGAGAGAVGKPLEGSTTNMGGESATQAAVKGTGSAAADGSAEASASQAVGAH